MPSIEPDLKSGSPAFSAGSKEILQVAVGVIRNGRGEILIAKRKRSSHQGGLWEFPGGKIEAHETARQALRRELQEELAIVVEAATPLMTVDHDYGDRRVRLLVWSVERFSGRAHGREGQSLQWVSLRELNRYAFPAANLPIISALQLPAYYAILDAPDEAVLWRNLQAMLTRDVKLIQARLKSLPAARAVAFVESVYPLCRQAGAALLLNSSIAGSDRLPADGLHLTGRHLLALAKKPERSGWRWLAASCHNAEELQQAQRLGLDFVVLAPVLPTATHPGGDHLGWRCFSELTGRVNLPVYALGGLTQADLPRVRQAGGQGIAGIRAFAAIDGPAATARKA